MFSYKKQTGLKLTTERLGRFGEEKTGMGKCPSGWALGKLVRRVLDTEVLKSDQWISIKVYV